MYLSPYTLLTVGLLCFVRTCQNEINSCQIQPSVTIIGRDEGHTCGGFYRRNGPGRCLSG